MSEHETPVNGPVYDEKKLALGLNLLKYVSWYFLVSFVCSIILGILALVLTSEVARVIFLAPEPSQVAIMFVATLVFQLISIGLSFFIWYFIKKKRTIVGAGPALVKFGIILLIWYAVSLPFTTDINLIGILVQCVAAGVTIYGGYLKKTNEPTA